VKPAKAMRDFFSCVVISARQPVRAAASAKSSSCFLSRSSVCIQLLQSCHWRSKHSCDTSTQWPYRTRKVRPRFSSLKACRAVWIAGAISGGSPASKSSYRWAPGLAPFRIAVGKHAEDALGYFLPEGRLEFRVDRVEMIVQQLSQIASIQIGEPDGGFQLVSLQPPVP
jgi:hypothetical protein